MLYFSTSNRSRPGGRHGDYARQAMLAGLLTCAAFVVGCQLMSQTEYTSPTFREQQQAILDVVPFGTPRGRALMTLEQAGVRGASGVSESIYYCDEWNRGDGSRWRLNAALFFDQSGRLYKVGPGQSDTGVAASVGNTANAKASRQQEAAAGDASPPDRLPTGRTGRRTPFTNPDNLR